MGIEAFRSQSLGKFGGREYIRVSFDTAQADGTIPVLPAGRDIHARDGRSFVVDDIHGVIARTELPLLLDRDHESESIFGSTKALGWGEGLHVVNGALFARVSYTDEGRGLVKSGAYKFSSPVLAIDPESRVVDRVISLALTNRPALRMSEVEAFSVKIAAKQASAVNSKAIESLRAHGLTEAQIAQALEVNPARGRAATNDELRTALRARGVLSDEQITAALALKPYGRP